MLGFAVLYKGQLGLSKDVPVRLTNYDNYGNYTGVALDGTDQVVHFKQDNARPCDGVYGILNSEQTQHLEGETLFVTQVSQNGMSARGFLTGGNELVVPVQFLKPIM